MEKKTLKITKRKYGGNSTVVSLRLPDRLVEKVDEIAANTDRTRNDIIIRFIDFGLENLQIENDADGKVED